MKEFNACTRLHLAFWVLHSFVISYCRDKGVELEFIHLLLQTNNANPWRRHTRVIPSSPSLVFSSILCLFIKYPGQLCDHARHKDISASSGDVGHKTVF